MPTIIDERSLGVGVDMLAIIVLDVFTAVLMWKSACTSPSFEWINPRKAAFAYAVSVSFQMINFGPDTK